MLSEEGLNVITLPKTIDNDLWGTEMTFGFQSAVDIATDTIDKIHSTATSHSRVFIIEVMGHKVGWVTLYAGIAGGADIVLLPEMPYDIDVVVEAINRRNKAGKRFTIIAVAEGAISQDDAKLSKKELQKKNAKYPSVAYHLAERIQNRMEQEVRITVPGHTQRGGEPCPYDRVISTRLGAAAGRAILNGEYGCMMGLKNDQVVQVPLDEVAGKLKYVDPNSAIIREAREIGISFGEKIDLGLSEGEEVPKAVCKKAEPEEQSEEREKKEKKDKKKKKKKDKKAKANKEEAHKEVDEEAYREAYKEAYQE
jgi:6-phosphofructokinase 1